MGSSVFVNAWAGVDNHGDELLLERLIVRLRDAGVTTITVTSFDPDATATLHGIDAVHPRNLIGVVRAIRRADLFVLGPGGLLQDASSPWNLPYQLHRAYLARLLRTPVLGLGLGAGPLGRRGSGTLLRAALGGASAVAVRDDASRVLLDRHRVDAVATADLAVGAPSPARPGGDAIVVSLRPHRPGGIVPVRWQRHRLDDDQVAAAAAALDSVADALGAPVRFVAFEPHTDHPLHRAVAERMTRDATCVVPEPGRLVDTMADARVVIATRYHAGITGLVADRPTVLIGYAPKVRALAETFGAAVALVDDTNEALAGLPAAVERALAADPSARRDALDRLRRAEAGHADLIAAALGR